MALLGIRNLFLYYVARPVVPFVSPELLAAFSYAISFPLGVVHAFRHRRNLLRKMDACGRRPEFLNCIRFARRSVYEELRHLDFYLYQGVPKLRVDWHDGKPETEPCVYATINRFGSEAIGAFMDRYPAVIIRTPFGGEGTVDIRRVRHRQKWHAYEAIVRANSSRGRIVEVGGSPMLFRNVLDGKHSLVIYQDVLNTEFVPPFYELLGRPMPLKIGAPRLARLAGGLPLRFISIEPQRGTWVVTVGERIQKDEKTLARIVDSEIRRRPEAWMLWLDFFRHVDRPASPVAPATPAHNATSATTLAAR